jgi:hypothetical protein
MCLGADAPALWYALPEGERAERAFLSSDECVIDDEHFFVRGRVVLPSTAVRIPLSGWCGCR